MTDNTGARLAIGAFPSSPIEDGLLSSLNSYSSLQEIADSNNIILKNIISYQLPNFPSWTTLLNIIDISLAEPSKNLTSSHVYTQNFKNTILQYSNYSKIYTDALKLENNVRIAIIYNNEIITYKLQKELSIYTAEATAILKALEYALEK
ncbi:hypothetical protein QTP88_026993 [Uroleucon formosanum]